MKTVTIYYAPLPQEIPIGEISGVTHQMQNGNYSVLIDARLSAAEQERTRRHEMAHILLNHFDAEMDIEAIEAEADEFADRMTV